MVINPRNNDEDSSAVARRRRKAKLTCKNISEKRPLEEMPEEVTSGDPKKPHITGIKNKTRYDPGVPMTRKELTAWRKEARRVRNRQSAAESRRRTRDKIEELEGKLSSLDEKYSAALKRIAELEGIHSSSSTQSHLVSQDRLGANGTESNDTKPVPAPGVTTVVSPIMSPVSSPKSSPRTFHLNEIHNDHLSEAVVKCQHINMISRPPAAKISGASSSTTTSLHDESVRLSLDDSYEDFDGEMSDFLLDALAPECPPLFPPILNGSSNENEHGAYLDSLCNM